jgi:hypothetical protein
MSEERSRFKIKKGDIEIEYSGMPKDVDSKYKEALDWVKSTTVTTSAPPKEPSAGRPKEPGKPARGGRRSPIISNAIDQMISEGDLDKAKITSEVLAELKIKAVPGVTIYNVGEALKRKARKGILDRIKGAGKEYSYIKKAEKKKT